MSSPRSRRSLGLFLVLAPVGCLALALILWPIAMFILSSLMMSGDSSGSSLALVGRVLNVILSFLGMIGVLGFCTALPVGLFFLFSTPTTKEQKPGQKK